MTAPTPHNEGKRLAALRALDILDTGPEPAFDDIARMAARVFDAPIALVCLIDSDRQWFKARVGLDVTETPRDWSLCAHAILDDRCLAVGDATRDARFRDSPLVTGEPNIRFYAGAPLVSPEGFNIGTVCVIDSEPRAAENADLETLETIRDAADAQLKLRSWRIGREHMPVVCAWCERAKIDAPSIHESARWVDAGRYLRETFPVSHGMCPDCHSERS